MMGESIMDYIHPKDHQKFCQQFLGMKPAVPKKRRSHPANRGLQDGRFEICVPLYWSITRKVQAFYNKKN